MNGNACELIHPLGNRKSLKTQFEIGKILKIIYLCYMMEVIRKWSACEAAGRVWMPDNMYSCVIEKYAGLIYFFLNE